MSGELYPAVHAKVTWTGRGTTRPFAPPWVGYTAHIKTIPPNVLHDEAANRWDIVVRQVRSVDEAQRSMQIVFQLASRRAPHSGLRVGLRFGLYHTWEPAWEGEVLELSSAPLEASYWRSLES